MAWKRKTLPPDKKDVRPATLADAKRLIEQTFRGQGKLGWDGKQSINFSLH
jgi:hypothetical protein